MDEDLTQLLQALRSDSARCAVLPATAIRRRGDHRRTAVRLAATGGTVALVGVTAGTGFALAQQAPSSHQTRVGIAGQTSPTPHRHAPRGHAGTATPTATPAPGSSFTVPPVPPSDQPTASPTPTSR